MRLALVGGLPRRLQSKLSPLFSALPESFRLKQGEPLVYYKTADSGLKRGHAFCGDCGSPVFWLPTDNNPNYSLRVGALGQRNVLGPPRRQIGVRRRSRWVPTSVACLKSTGLPICQR